jgi:tRNA (guanine37-N1)-methyltransferase
VRIDILTLFPEMFRGPFDASIVARAVQQGIVSIELCNIRDWGEGRHNVVDDYPYGGGPGMVMKPGPLFDAVEAVQALDPEPGRIVLLTPQGRLLTEAVATELTALPRLLLICGHYEGVDERVREHLVDDEISIGDYVLSGGELAAMVVVDAVVRRLPGALGSEESLAEESHSQGLLEYPQYTRPPDFRGWQPPDVLLSGHHEEVRRWRRLQSLLRTARRRPDLLAKACLTDEERAWLASELEAGG